MIKKHFGTVDDYAAALAAVIAEGVPQRHIDLLRAHYESPRHIATARQLARTVGYVNYGGVNMQYGTLAHRVASRLGVVEPPNGFWLFVLVDWASSSDPRGDTRFRLRAPVVEALQRLGYPWATGVRSNKRMEPSRAGSRTRAAHS
jgi:hypothetical protein